MIASRRPVALLAAVVIACGEAPVAQEFARDWEGDPKLDRKQATEIIAKARRLVGDDAVERPESIRIGGINQWISIRGADRRHPVLLFLAGGPGGSAMAMNWPLDRSWEDHFTVVHWDQRGVGKTYLANDPEEVAPTLTLQRIVDDAEELVGWLRRELGKERIFLLGQSWGTYLGVEVARRRPEWLHAYVGVGQITDVREGEGVGWRFALEQAREEGNETAVSEIEAIAPFPGEEGSLDVSKLRVQRKWLDYYGGVMYGRRGATQLIRDLSRLSPDYSDVELQALPAGSRFSEALARKLDTIDLTTVRRLECPVIVFNGRHDYLTPATLTAEWFERLEAPLKTMVWFERSGHVITLEEPGKVLAALLEHVRPLAERTGEMAAADGLADAPGGAEARR